MKDCDLVGVAIAGRPVERLLDDGKTLEVTRVCVKEGFPNACSKLYARVRRIGQLFGYEKIKTYTLVKESQSSLKAISAVEEARVLLVVGTPEVEREETKLFIMRKKLAREILAMRKTLVAEGRHLEKKRIPKTTFFELCDEYWETWGKHKRMKGLGSMLMNWRTGIGDVPLQEVSRLCLERFLNNRIEADGVFNSDAQPAPDHAQGHVQQGQRMGTGRANPTAGIQRLRENGARTRFLDQVEVRELIQAASKDFRPVVITAVHTGMRRGEILNLQWQDVDFKTRLITIQQSKSGRKRMIPIDDTLHRTLRVLPSRFQKGYVFTSPARPGEKRLISRGSSGTLSAGQELRTSGFTTHAMPLPAIWS